MQIIPVIDILNGVVVHARQGNRHAYQPIQSLLCKESSPEAVINALLELYPFNTLYIADIDAIMGTGNHFDHVAALMTRYPQVTFWLDCGIRQMNHRALHIQQNIRPVVGSENMQNLISYKAVSYACASRHVLSLDYRANQAMGISTLHETAKYWPDDTICMTLQRVGSETGVDFEQLSALQTLNQQRKIASRLYAAGGVRHIEDCHQLQTHGIYGALIATALHNKQISAADLTTFHRHLAST